MEELETVSKVRADHSSMNIKELFFKYVRFLPLYIICVSLALFGSYIYLRYATEAYRSAGQIIIRDDKTAPMNDKLSQAMQSDGQKNIQTEIEVLQSRPLMERAVVALGLNYEYYVKGKIKELNSYKRCPFKLETLAMTDSAQGFTLNLNFPDQQSFTIEGSSTPIAIGQEFTNTWGKFRIVRINKLPFQAQCKVVYNPTPVEASMLAGGLVVVPKQNTGILTISMEATNPQMAADVINALMVEYQKVTIEEKNIATQNSLQFIDTNLKERQKELDSITQNLVSYQKLHNIIDPQLQASNYLARVEDAHKMEQTQRLQLSNANQIQDYVRGNEQGLVPSSLGIDDPTLNGLVSSYNKAQLERKDLLENAQPGHVIVQQKAEEIAALRGKILENVKNIQSSYNRAIGTLQSSSGEAITQLQTLPTKKQEILDIQNQLASKMLIYNQLLSKRDELGITLASTISNIKVLQEAGPDGTPVKPDRRSAHILAFFVGLLIPTIVIVILELLNDKISSRHDIERLTDATILGEVGHSYGDKTLVVTAGNRRVIAEQFRILRSNLQYVLTQAPKPVIMVTSSFSGEGKSFISTNVGAVMALANKKTIILEFDIRKPKIASGLQIPKHSGLTNFILGQVKMEELPVKVTGYDNLYILPCGPVPPNPAELLLDPKLDDLFIYLRQNFDVVIMDTAPVGMVSDAMTLSKYADCTLYIVRQGHTYKRQMSLVDSYNNDGKLPKVSVILNDVKVQKGYGSYGYGGNYGYGYGYGYGSGYFEEEPEYKTGLSKWVSWLGFKSRPAKNQKSI